MEFGHFEMDENTDNSIDNKVEKQETTENNVDKFQENAEKKSSADKLMEAFKPKESNENTDVDEDGFETIDAKDIDTSNIRGLKSPEDIEKFWEQPHYWEEGISTKEDYIRLAEKLPEVQSKLKDGESLETLKEDATLKDCIDAYYNPDNMVTVEKTTDGKYEFQDNGRHRVQAAKEVGCEIPVKVVERNSPSEGTENIEVDTNTDEKESFKDKLKGIGESIKSFFNKNRETEPNVEEESPETIQEEDLNTNSPINEKQTEIDKKEAQLESYKNFQNKTLEAYKEKLEQNEEIQSKTEDPRAIDPRYTREDYETMKSRVDTQISEYESEIDSLKAEIDDMKNS